MLRWENFRPMSDWVVVKADPRVKKTAGGVILTDELTKVERVMEGTGRVLKCGPEARKDVEPGQRICFRGFLKDVFCEFARDEDNCPIFLLRGDDVLAVISDDVAMGEYSGMVPRDDGLSASND